MRVTENLHQQTCGVLTMPHPPTLQLAGSNLRLLGRFWQGRGGSVTHTISGIDIALWDIFGKLTQQPISRLLGGRYRERVRPYGSLLMAEPDEMKERVRDAKDRGFRSFKIGWGPFGRVDAAMDEAIVAAAREEAGPDCEIMVDAGGSDAMWPHGYKWALQTARMLAKYDVTCVTAPWSPESTPASIPLPCE